MNGMTATLTGALLAAAPLAAQAHHETSSAMHGGALFFTGAGLACVLWFFLRRVWS